MRECTPLAVPYPSLLSLLSLWLNHHSFFLSPDQTSFRLFSTKFFLSPSRPPLLIRFTFYSTLFRPPFLFFLSASRSFTNGSTDFQPFLLCVWCLCLLSEQRRPCSRFFARTARCMVRVRTHLEILSAPGRCRLSLQGNTTATVAFLNPSDINPIARMWKQLLKFFPLRCGRRERDDVECEGKSE